MADNDKKENGSDSASSTNSQRKKDNAADKKQTSTSSSSSAPASPASEPKGKTTAAASSPSRTDKSASKQRTAKPATKPASTGGLWFVLILTLLLTLALAGAGYWYYMQRDSNNQALTDAQTQQSERIEAMNQQNRELQQQLAELGQARQSLNQAISELQDKTQTLQQQNQQALAQLDNMEGKRPSDWLLAEADYLVRMAGRKVWLEKDIKTAIMLLSNADERLSELADPSVLPVRERIAKDIQMLRQLNPVSRTSVALAISGMLSQVETLPLDTFEQPADGSNEEDLSESVDDWQANLKRVWRNIVDDFISVTRTETAVEPVMSRQEQWLNREQLKLQMMQAQSAAIGGNKTLYDQSLQNAMDILVKKYDMDAAPVQQYLEALQNLVETDISQNLPESLDSAEPLRRLLDKRVDDAFGQGARAL
ncbi:uroporphyrinogen-III C-methyltransferase [Salinimonas chungwhensis]|uniref:uroporphyrinogen-III C-methyltransferase n=1 Tax=Salinimonas chungwhensis TaxID=265425 RepID=UPI0003637C7D|nr:uroporphyrinogen-III C-methyltransferase [Salinimonas chungwhensis]